MSNMNPTRGSADCAQIRPLLEEYFERVLPARQEALVSAHISWCERCAAELAQISKMVAALEAAPVAEPSAESLRAISARVAEMPSPAEQRRVSIGWGRLAVYAAAMATAAGGLLLLLPIVWAAYSRMGAPASTLGHRLTTAGGSLLANARESAHGWWPAVQGWLHARWLSLPAAAPTIAAYIAAEIALMGAVVLICSLLRRRAVQVPSVSSI